MHVAFHWSLMYRVVASLGVGVHNWWALWSSCMEGYERYGCRQGLSLFEWKPALSNGPTVQVYICSLSA